jgi:hypothetical protein
MEMIPTEIAIQISPKKIPKSPLGAQDGMKYTSQNCF